MRGKPLRQLWRRHTNTESGGIMLSTILIIVLILLLIGALPSWPYSRGWGYGPTGGLGLIVVIVVILVLLGYI
jgi:sterol desaturase/sphingolipid hydroxylase (fatty acid hydroxylase superfamily)